MKVEISFDDGQVGDLKAARLLKQYGFVGTFYVPNVQVPKTVRATHKEIKEIIVQECGQVIGGHTVTHPMDMKLIEDDEELSFEIINNKNMIRQLYKQDPKKFCYPRGRHDERVREAVRKLGEYDEARTTRVLQILNDTGDPMQTPTTIHMFQREEYGSEDWFTLAHGWFLKALEASRTNDKVFFSIWGHANEIERQGDWGRLEDFLRFMNGYKNEWHQQLSPTGAFGENGESNL